MTASYNHFTTNLTSRPSYTYPLVRRSTHALPTNAQKPSTQTASTHVFAPHPQPELQPRENSHSTPPTSAPDTNSECAIVDACAAILSTTRHVIRNRNGLCQHPKHGLFLELWIATRREVARYCQRPLPALSARTTSHIDNRRNPPKIITAV